MFFNIIGAGRLGKNIAQALIKGEQATLAGVFNSTWSSTELAVSQIGSGVAIARIEDLPVADLTFITTPDDHIAEMVTRLANHKRLAYASTVVHCSGVLNSDILLPLREQQCHIASLHPLKAFREGLLVDNAFQGCDCALEGDAGALFILSSLFKPLGANLFTIASEKKASYHAAAVMAANYLVTLADNANSLLQQAGISQVQAHEIITRLMQSSLDNIKQSPTIANALTGPLARGDISTMCQHLKALHNPDTKLLYQAATLATLPLTTLSEEKKSLIRQAFVIDFPA